MPFKFNLSLFPPWVSRREVELNLFSCSVSNVNSSEMRKVRDLTSWLYYLWKKIVCWKKSGKQPLCDVTRGICASPILVMRCVQFIRQSMVQCCSTGVQDEEEPSHRVWFNWRHQKHFFFFWNTLVLTKLTWKKNVALSFWLYLS